MSSISLLFSGNVKSLSIPKFKNQEKYLDWSSVHLVPVLSDISLYRLSDKVEEPALVTIGLSSFDNSD